MPTHQSTRDQPSNHRPGDPSSGLPGRPSDGDPGPPVGGDLDRPGNGSRRRVAAEIWIVIALSLGASGLKALLRLVDRLTRTESLAQQSTVMHAPQSARPVWDLVYQMADIALALAPVLLVVYLLGGPPRAALARIGLNATRPLRDLGWGVALAAGIGLPGLGFYALGRAAGITVEVVPSQLNAYWWTVPVLVLSAAQNGLLEEVVVVAYLSARLDRLGWGPWAAIAASAVLRGTYHAYQGIGPVIGNIAMGVVFAWWYRRSGRVAPLVAAHTLIDIVAFVGPSLVPVGWLP